MSIASIATSIVTSFVIGTMNMIMMTLCYPSMMMVPTTIMVTAKAAKADAEAEAEMHC